MSKAMKVELDTLYAVEIASENYPYHYTEPTVEALVATQDVTVYATTNPDFDGDVTEMSVLGTLSQGEILTVDGARGIQFIAVSSTDTEAEVYVSGFKLKTKHYAVDTITGGVLSGYHDNDLVMVAGGDNDKLAEVRLKYVGEEKAIEVESSSEELGTVTVDEETFESKLDDGEYEFEAVEIPELLIALIGEAPEEGEPDTRVEKSYHYLQGGGDYPDVFEAWVNVEDETDIVYTPIRNPHAGDAVYSEPDVEAGEVKEYVEEEIKWFLESEEVVLADYGIEFTGTAQDGSVIEISSAMVDVWDYVIIYAGEYASDIAGECNIIYGSGKNGKLTVTTKVIFA